MKLLKPWPTRLKMITTRFLWTKPNQLEARVRYVLEDETQRVTRRVLWPGKRRHNYYQRKKKSSIHTLWAKSAQLLFKLKFISRIKPLYKLGGMW